jgi:hypothetical protein
VLLHGLHEAKPQLGQCIFDDPLFFDTEIAASLLLEHRKHIDGMPRYWEIRPGPVFFLAEMQEAQVHFRLCLQGKHQELESCGREWKILIAHFIHYFNRSRWRNRCYGALDWGFRLSNARRSNHNWRTI